jgi:arsenate reductase
MVIKVLENAGFESLQLSKEENPVIMIKYSADNHPITA